MSAKHETLTFRSRDLSDVTSALSTSLSRQSGQPVEPMRHFGEGREQEERENGAEMDRKEGRHDRRLTQRVECKSTEADKAQQSDKGHLSAKGGSCAQGPVRTQLQADHLDAAHHKQKTTGNAQNFGQRQKPIGRGHVEHVVHHGRDTGGGKHNRKPYITA